MQCAWNGITQSSKGKKLKYMGASLNDSWRHYDKWIKPASHKRVNIWIFLDEIPTTGKFIEVIK